MTKSAPHWDALVSPDESVSTTLALLLPMATRYACEGFDHGDVANLATCLAPALLARGYSPSESAAIAVQDAWRGLTVDRRNDVPTDENDDTDTDTDTDTVPAEAMARARTPRYVGADTRPVDYLHTALALARPYLTDRQADIIRECGHAGAFQASRLPVAKIGAALDGRKVTGRAAVSLAAEIRAALTIVRECLTAVLDHDARGTGDRLAPLAHFSRTLGPRPVLRFAPVSVAAGTATVRTVDTMSSDFAWQSLTMHVRTGLDLNGYPSDLHYGPEVSKHYGHGRPEVERAGILAGTDTLQRGASRPSGVATGMRHGAAGSPAGSGTPTPRPVVSRKGGKGGQTGPTVPDRR